VVSLVGLGVLGLSVVISPLGELLAVVIAVLALLRAFIGTSVDLQQG